MKAKIKNMDLMKVKDNENIYYGFSQKWYKDSWQKEADCGSIFYQLIMDLIQ